MIIVKRSRLPDRAESLDFGLFGIRKRDHLSSIQVDLCQPDFGSIVQTSDKLPAQQLDVSRGFFAKSDDNLRLDRGASKLKLVSDAH